MGIQKTPFQKTCKINIGSQNFIIDFLRANRQFHWLETPLTFDKSDKHSAFYDSYNVKKVTTLILLLELENIFEAYSFLSKMEFDVINKTQKNMLYKQFVTWNCDGCCIAPLADYINNPIF